MRLVATPDKTNSPPIVDSNAVPPRPVCLQRFETISRRTTKILQPFGGMKVEELSPGNALDGSEPEYDVILKERLSVSASKRPDQDRGVFPAGYSVKRNGSTAPGKPRPRAPL